jgi:hypothetical protein
VSERQLSVFGGAHRLQHWHVTCREVIATHTDEPVKELLADFGADSQHEDLTECGKSKKACEKGTVVPDNQNRTRVAF